MSPNNYWTEQLFCNKDWNYGLNRCPKTYHSVLKEILSFNHLYYILMEIVIIIMPIKEILFQMVYIHCFKDHPCMMSPWKFLTPSSPMSSYITKYHIHSCPKVYIQLTFRFTFSAAISKSLELKRSSIAL